MPAEQRRRFLDIKLMTIAECESLGTTLATQQRDVMFQIGDLYRYAEARWPDKHHQIWPEWASPGMLQRAAGVCKAYPTEEDRRHNVTYTQYMQAAGKPNRHEILAAIESEGLTTDQSRKSPQPETGGKPRWLLAVDVNLYVCSHFHAGAKLAAGSQVAQWIVNTVERLRKKHNNTLTDVVCCFDSYRNHRKELTAGWEKPYKDRDEKDPEIPRQIQIARQFLEAKYTCVSVDGFEADDVMASYATQFPGNVTLLTKDKDHRQCLSPTCNMLIRTQWELDDFTQQNQATDTYVTATLHVHFGCPYGTKVVKGLSPAQWIEMQMLAGDSSDTVEGAVGIGGVTAAALVTRYGTADAAVEAAEAGDKRITQKKREALVSFRPRLEITRQLVTLRTDLAVPMTTRLPVPAEDSMQSDEIDRLAGLMP